MSASVKNSSVGGEVLKNSTLGILPRTFLQYSRRNEEERVSTQEQGRRRGEGAKSRASKFLQWRMSAQNLKQGSAPGRGGRGGRLRIRVLWRGGVRKKAGESNEKKGV